MITLAQYFGKFIDHPDATDTIKDNAHRLLAAVAGLEAVALADGVEFTDNPATGSGVSGQTYGGFRPQDCPQGAKYSSHKQGMAVDLYDPSNAIDDWCIANLQDLENFGIYIEHPNATPRWSHWTIRAPKSGKRVFLP